jgi:hypothetical protein
MQYLKGPSYEKGMVKQCFNDQFFLIVQSKNPTEKEPRYLIIEAEVLSQKIALRSDFIKKIMKMKKTDF